MTPLVNGDSMIESFFSAVKDLLFWAARVYWWVLVWWFLVRWDRISSVTRS